MKRLLKSKIIDKKFIKGIIKERNLLSKMNHPFLVNMHFSFQDNRYLYMILDLMKGGDLRYYYKLYNQENNEKKFSESECKFMVTNLMLALEYIHNNNIVHCDIKPENIVIDKNGYFCLTDFGIAKNLEEDEDQNNPSNLIAGSLGYMAPEIMFQEKCDYFSDFFSLGVVCYEMMMGKLPYYSNSLEGIKQLIMANQVQIKKFNLPPGWSNESLDFINKLIQRKPLKRLGYFNYDDIKNHPWLNNVDWSRIYMHEIKSPFIPDLNRNENKEIYFNDQKKENEESKQTLERYKIIELNNDYKLKFDEFYYFNKYSMKYYKDKDKFINPHSKYEEKENKSIEINSNRIKTCRNKKKSKLSILFNK